MSWVDKAHKKNKIYNMVEQAMKDPRYQAAEKKKMEDATRQAFDRFLLISADFLYRNCRFGKQRMLKYIDFVVYQMHCIETDPEYFTLLNDALADEIGMDILASLGRNGGTNEGGCMRTVLHYPGGKKRIAPWIINHMLAHHSYLEPYFGCGAVLFSKQPSRIETVNDLDGEVVNFFRVVRNPESRKELQEWIAYTPYARQEYDETFLRPPGNPIERAGYFAIRSMQSHGFRLTGDCGWKKDVHGRESAYAVRYWNKLPEVIAEMGIRLKQVQIENRPALELIENFNYENVLMYLDPPYVRSTRDGREQYQYEMSDREHIELLEAIIKSKAKIMISGYDSELYDYYIGDWNKVQIAARTQSNKQRTETLWMNYNLEPEQIMLQI